MHVIYLSLQIDLAYAKKTPPNTHKHTLHSLALPLATHQVRLVQVVEDELV